MIAVQQLGIAKTELKNCGKLKLKAVVLVPQKSDRKQKNGDRSLQKASTSKKFTNGNLMDGFNAVSGYGGS